MGSVRRARSVPRIPELAGRWLQPSRPAPRNTNVRRIRLPGPAAVLAFTWIDIPAGLALSWQHSQPRSRHPPRLCGSARPCARLPWRGGSAGAGRSAAAALSGSVMRKM